MSNMVSIVIPVYNAEKYLRQCIDSIMCQSYENFEVICVDDGSTDSSHEILKEYERNDRRFKVLSQENCGAGLARNKGLAVAGGKYCMFLDADDFFEETFVEKMLNETEVTESDICTCEYALYHSIRQAQIGHVKIKKEYLNGKGFFSPSDISEYIFEFSPPTVWTKMYDRSFIDREGILFQDTVSSNDIFFHFISLATANRICTLFSPLVNYRVGTDTNLQSNKGKNPLVFYKALKKIKDNLEDRELYPIYKNSYVNMAAYDSIYNIETVGSALAQDAIFKKMQDHIFNDLDITGFSNYHSDVIGEKIAIISSGNMEDYLRYMVRDQEKHIEFINELQRAIVWHKEQFEHLEKRSNEREKWIEEHSEKQEKYIEELQKSIAWNAKHSEEQEKWIGELQDAIAWNVEHSERQEEYIKTLNETIESLKMKLNKRA